MRDDPQRRHDAESEHDIHDGADAGADDEHLEVGDARVPPEATVEAATGAAARSLSGTPIRIIARSIPAASAGHGPS